MARLGEISLWMWIMGLTVAGVVVFTTGMHMNENQMNSIGRQMTITEFSELIAKARLACDAGEGTSYPYIINIADDVKAIYSAAGVNEPPDKVSVLITRSEQNIGNYICIRYNGDDEPYCEEMDCDINMTYLGQASMEDSLIRNVKDEMGIESNAFEIVIRKTHKNTVYIGAEEIIPIEMQPVLCGNGELDSDEQCEGGNAQDCEQTYGKCSSTKCVNCRCISELDCDRCSDEVCVEGSDWEEFCKTQEDVCEDIASDDIEDGDNDSVDEEEEPVVEEGDVVTVSTIGDGDFNCEGNTCEDEINDAIEFVKANDGYTTVHLNGPGTFWIDGSIYLKNNMILEGDSDAVVKLVADANWYNMYNGLVDVDETIDGTSGVTNVVIRGFKIDGNRENQDQDIGLGYYNTIKLRRAYNVQVYDMYLTNNLGDGVMVDHGSVNTNPVNIFVHDNTIYEVGHDAVYLKRMSNALVYNNRITCNVNSGVRIYNTNHVKIYNNVINSHRNGGSAVQVEAEHGTVVDDVEIYNNIIYETSLWGILIRGYVGTTPETSKDIYIHHNLIFGTGTSYGDQREGGISIYGFHNTIIESNTIDYNRKAGIIVGSDDDADDPVSVGGFVTIVRNNIITNSVDYNYGTEQYGYGIMNDATSTHSFVIYNNCIYGNDGGNYKNVNPGTNDINADPLYASETWSIHDESSAYSDYHLKSTYGRWDGNSWVTDSANSPCIDAGYASSDYSKEPEDNGNSINIGVYGNTKEASLSGPLAEDEEEDDSDGSEEEDDVWEDYEADIVIDDDAEPAVSGASFYLTSDYANDAACIQAALDDAENGDTIVIREGDYYITKQIYQRGKSLNIIGEGEVIFDIHTGSSPGFYFMGTVITNTGLSTDAQEGETRVTLNDASKVRVGDLIKIWKNVQWCPLDYPEQTTGELYLVRGVSGNIVTLNEPLIRDYDLSDTVSVEISRPIEMHVKNIRVQNVDPTGIYEGLMLRYCKDCSLTDSWFKDNGQAAVRVFTGFNVDVKDNEIYDCIHEGNGYGVSVAEASAFVTIDGNHIENCRHDIMSGTADFKALNRDIVISNNVLIGANIAASHVVDSHPNTIDYIVTKNKIYPQPNYNAFYDGTFESVFSDNEIYGGHGVVSRRGNVNNGIHTIKNNRIEDSGYLYGGIGTAIGDTLIIKDNIQNGGWYGVGMNTESFRNIIISGNKLSDFTARGVDIKYHINGVNIEVTDNTFENFNKEGVYIDGTSYTSGDVEITNNIFRNVYPSSPSNVIRTINIQNPVISGNQIND